MLARHLALGVSALFLMACDSVGVDLAPEADADAWTEMLTAVNTLRAQGGVCGGERMAPAPALVWDERLESAARGHAADMAEHGYFGHTGSDGSSLGERVDRTGYDWAVVGENLARYQRSIGEVVTDWQQSEGHCRQLHDPAFAEVGAALVDNHWVQVFGYPR
ncbi:MAG: CAP domain-containing protein [Bacteroidota bacterium]